LSPLNDLLDDKYGLIKDFVELGTFPGEPPYNFYGATLKRTEIKPSGGGFSKERAQNACLGEAIERYCMFEAPLEQIQSSWKKLGKQALHPDTIPGYLPSQFKSKDFPFQPVTEDSIMPWVKGEVITKNKRAIYVPLQAIHPKQQPPHFFAADSCGNACGATKEAAILTALCEAIERDSFFVMWQNRLSMPLVDYDPPAPKGFQKDFELFFLRPHLEYFIINMTTDLEIPVFAAVCRQKYGDGPPFALGSACRLNPQEAILKALLEAASIRRLLIRLTTARKAYPDSVPENEIFEQVKEIEDHSFLYNHRRFIGYADFLFSSKKRNLLSKLPNLSTGDVKKDLQYCLKTLEKKGYEVIVVDITQPQIRRHGFFIVKVIVPKLQLAHWGWNMGRLKNPRLYEVPKLLGYDTVIRTERDIYTIPHPYS